MEIKCAHENGFDVPFPSSVDRAGGIQYAYLLTITA